MPRQRISRRRFLRDSAVTGVGLAASASLVFADERPMPMRTFGSTGLKVSLAGLGCFPLGRGGVKNSGEANGPP